MMQENIYTNVVPVTLSANRMNISFAMPMPANPELLSIMNKGVNSLSEDDRISLRITIWSQLGMPRYH